MNQQLVQAYEQQMKSAFMLNLVCGEAATLKETMIEILQANKEKSKYIISAYYKVRKELVG